MSPAPHDITLETGRPHGSPAGPWHRWSCSCGRVGDWTRGESNAKIGGSNHRTAAHLVDMDTAPVSNGAGQVYRWRCACGRLGPWKHRAFNARAGGGKHVAMMERSK